MQGVFVVTAVVAATELLKRLKEKDFTAAATICVAALIGALAGVFGVEGLTVVTGIVAGLSAAGTYTVASKIG